LRGCCFLFIPTVGVASSALFDVAQDIAERADIAMRIRGCCHVRIVLFIAGDHYGSVMDADMQVSDRIGRRMKLHDLHVLMAVVQAGSMSKAAALLHTGQSAISRSIAELEHTIGVRLLDRSRQGVEPTPYGRALLAGGAAVFDDLRQAVKNIELLADPTAGEIRVGAQDLIIGGLLPTVFSRLRRQYPGIAMNAIALGTIPQQYHELRERRIDLFLGRLPNVIEDDIAAEVLFHDRSVVVAGLRNKWTSRRRRKIDLAELADEPWSIPPPEMFVGSLVANAFRASGMTFPPRGVAFGTTRLHYALLASGPFVSIIPSSLLRFDPNLPPLRVLPVDLPDAFPVGVMTLKNRTLTPVAELFIKCAREVTKPLAARN
jgi:DNA-binding transcriptional LysR family regulator